MEYLRRLMQKANLAATDEELARRQSVRPYYGGAAEGRPSMTASRADGRSMLEASPKLREFRVLVGIWSDHSFGAPRGFNPTHRPTVTVSGRPAPNMGIYVMVVDKEVKARKNYKRFSVTINVALGLQLIVAAALTALGAAGGPRGGVTFLGAVNTIIAGFLTFLKGSGLPNRLKYFQHEWDKVREYIEARERDLIVSDDAFDVYEQVEEIRHRYEAVKKDVESNTPDRYVSSGRPKTQPETMAIVRPGANGNSDEQSDNNTPGKLSRMTSTMSEQAGRNGDPEKGALGFGQGLSARAHDTNVHFLSPSVSLKDRSVDKVKEMSDLEQQIQHNGSAAVKLKEAEGQTQLQEADSLRSTLVARSSRMVEHHEEQIARLRQEISDRSRSIADLRTSGASTANEPGPPPTAAQDFAPRQAFDG